MCVKDHVYATDADVQACWYRTIRPVLHYNIFPRNIYRVRQNRHLFFRDGHIFILILTNLNCCVNANKMTSILTRYLN